MIVLSSDQGSQSVNDSMSALQWSLQPFSNFLTIVTAILSHLSSDAHISMWSTLHQNREAILEVSLSVSARYPLSLGLECHTCYGFL